MKKLIMILLVFGSIWSETNQTIDPVCMIDCIEGGHIYGYCKNLCSY